jgi:hypothetical protein
MTQKLKPTLIARPVNMALVTFLQHGVRNFYDYSPRTCS